MRDGEDALRFMEAEGSCGAGGKFGFCSEDCRHHGQHVATTEALGKPFAYTRQREET